MLIFGIEKYLSLTDMPSSPLTTIPGIMKAISKIKPKSVLDLGIGFGKFGFLIREYFDLRPGPKKGYDKWSMKIDGIEIFKDYITPVQEYIYDDIYIGETVEIISASNMYYDLVIGIDILEHYRKKDGIYFINTLKSITDNIIISTPYIYFEQPPLFGNRYEEHFSGWDFYDFKHLGFNYIWKTGVSMVGVYSSKDYDLINAKDVSDTMSDSNDLLNLFELLDMYYNTSQYAECIEISERYLPKLGNSASNIYMILARCYRELGIAGKSIEYAKKVIELDKENREARNILNVFS